MASLRCIPFANRNHIIVPRRFPFLVAALTVLASAIALIPGAATAFQYDRGAIAAGQLWRLVTGHWAHWGGEHLAWDLLVFAVFGALLERRSRRTFALVVAGSALAISAALWFAAPQFQLYRGLSGVDSALFTAFFAQLLRDAWHERSPLQGSVPALALAGFVGKSAYELATGATLFVDTSAAFVAVPLAHLAGAAVGLVVGSRLFAERRCPRQLTHATALRATPPTLDSLPGGSASRWLDQANPRRATSSSSQPR